MINLTDHRGNIRTTTYRDPLNTTVEAVQKRDYYLFGNQRSIVSGADNRYLYNGKDEQDELGAGDQYDYEPR